MAGRLITQAYLLFIAVFYLADAQTSGDQTVMMPPAITQQPNEVKTHFYVQFTSTTLLPCVATGSPAVKFSWKKNGVLVEPKPIPVLGNFRTTPGVFYNAEPQGVKGVFNGSIVIYGAGEAVTGSYQCFVEIVGAPKVRGMSSIAYIHQQHFSSFPDPDLKLRTIMVAAGEYVPLPCPALPIEPTPVTSWFFVRVEAQLVDNRRIILDDTGTLHILNAVPNGTEFLGEIECLQQNVAMAAKAIGLPTQLTMEPNSEPTYRAPKVVYVSDSPTSVVAVDPSSNGSGSSSSNSGSMQIIYCIFSGNPTPTVTWSREDGLPLGAGVVPDGALLKFRAPVQSDAARYVCTATNQQPGGRSPVVTQQVTVNVYVKPRLLQSPPTLINRFVGEDVLFDCTAFGVPTPAYQWYVNSVPEKDSEEVMSGDLRVAKLDDPGFMHLINLKKRDSGVFACNVSNSVGYQLQSYALNVLNKTNIVTFTPVVYANWSDTATLSCTADADSGLRLDVYWAKKGASVPIVTIGDRGVFVYSADRGKTARLTLELSRMNKSEQIYWASTAYDCVATTSLNGGTARVTANVVLPDMPEAAGNATGEAVIAAEVVQSAGFELWMIGVIVGIAVLIALIISVVCILRRQRGGSYKVDENERAQGNDPLKELRRDGFADYVRPDQDPSKGIRPVLEDVENGISVGSDDEDSMGEYGQADTARFDEDGSFIGQYGLADRPKSQMSPQNATNGPQMRASMTPNSVLRSSAMAQPPVYPTYDIEKSPLLESETTASNGSANHNGSGIDAPNGNARVSINDPPALV